MHHIIIKTIKTRLRKSILEEENIMLVQCQNITSSETRNCNCGYVVFRRSSIVGSCWFQLQIRFTTKLSQTKQQMSPPDNSKTDKLAS